MDNGGHEILIKRENSGLLNLKYVWQLNSDPVWYSEPLAKIHSRKLSEGLSQFTLKGIDDSKAPFKRDIPIYYLNGDTVNKIFPELDIKREEIPPSENEPTQS